MCIKYCFDNEDMIDKDTTRNYMLTKVLLLFVTLFNQNI